MLAALLAASLAVIALAPAPQEDPAALLPADTLVYFGTNSVRDGFEASQNTAMSKILEEPEVRAFLHEPKAAANRVLKMLLTQAISEAGGDEFGLAEADMDVSIDDIFMGTEAPPVGQVFVALTHVVMPDASQPQENPDEDMVPDLGLVAGVELLDENHVAMLQGMWSMIPIEESRGERAGIQYLTKPIPDLGWDLSLAVIGNTAVFSLSEDVLLSVLDRHAGAESAGPSLADSVDYRSMLDAAGGLLPGGSSYLMKVGDLSDTFRDLMTMGLMQDGADAEELGQALGLYEAFGFDAIRMVGGVSAVDTQGRILSTSVISADLNAPGLAAKMLQTGGALDLEVLSEIPENAISASANSGSNVILAVYDFAMEAVQATEPEAYEQVNEMIASIMGESDLRRDVLANLHGATMSFTVPGEGFPGTPNSFYRMGIRDPDAFVAALGNLLEGAGAQVGFPLSIRESDHQGQAFYELDLSATPMGAMLQPAFTFRDGQILASDSAMRLKDKINGALGTGELAKKKGYEAFLGKLKSKGAITATTYSNNEANFSVAYGQVVPMVQMFGAGLGDLPVNLTKLPTKQAVAQHLHDSYVGTYETKGGYIVNQSVSQFQMTDLLPIAAIAGLVYAGQELGMKATPEVEQVDPSDQAQKDLRELKAGITVYKIAEGAYPDALADLVRPLPDFPNGAFSRGELPNDPWGNAYHYTQAMHPTKNRMMPKLWSNGPDGVNNGGEGDDIVQF